MPVTPLWRSAVSGLALAAGLSIVGPIVAAPAAQAASTADPADPAAVDAAAPVTVGHLQTNGRVDPLGIPGERPSLSWQSTSTARGVTQSAYQVRVATSQDTLASGPLWDSGKVAGDAQTDVEYGGEAALTSATRYLWQVRVWDGDDLASDWSTPASFETGLLQASDWKADWIGGSTASEVDSWTDYTTDVDFDIDKLAVGVFIRAADTSNAYMWQISTADGSPKLRPHVRVNGGYRLLGNIPIPGVTSQQLLTGVHRLSVDVDGSTITTRLDGNQIDQRTDTTLSKGFVGFRQDFADGQGDESADIKAVKVTSKTGVVLLDTDFTAGNPFDGGTLTAAGLRVADRKDVLYRSREANKPLLRTDFTTEPGKTVASARVYASAQGVYELQLNGAKVGDQLLAPGWTDYRKRIQHQTYDVTEQVRDGANALGAELGDGWWSGKIASFGFDHYGKTLGLVAQLRIDYTDGTSQLVTTDDTWTSHTGPYVQADNIEGETYDANAEQPGWDQPGFDDAGWSPVTAATDTTAQLVPQPDEPVRVTGELATVARTTPQPGVDIYDVGQNMVGVARMRLTGTAGSTVRIRYGEELNPDGTLYTANLRSATVTDHYTFAADGTVTYTPKFTQHGFRYLEITGTATAPAASDVTGVVWGSDLAATGALTTSDPMLDQLVSNISWGQRGNFLSVPTDTPARDERLGWTGDINVFAPTASYLRDTRGFLGKWMTDLRDAAYADGNVPGIAPTVPNAGDFGSGLGWSDAAVTVPYATWKAWGDGKIVRDNYAAMTKFLTYVQASAGADLIDSGRGHWEDWLNLDDPTGVDVLGTMYYAEDARMLSEMAAGIGRTAEAAQWAQLSADVREAFASTLVAADGTVKGNSQAGYAMALGMGMITDPALREKVAAKFVAKLAATDNHLTTGFLGTPWLLPALSSIGRDDLAYTMLLKKDYPSWGYEIENGATTMWERWNSIMPDGSFGDVNMNSFNHYAYGAVGDWMYQNIGGIKALEAGYKKIRVAPVVGGGLTHGAGSFDSAYGPITTDWSTTDGDLSLAVDVPVGTTAEVVLPAATTWAVTEGGSLLDDVDGVTAATAADGDVTVTVGSGSYDFAVTSANEVVGSVLDAVDAVQDRVAELATAGDLDAASRTEVDGRLDDVRADVAAALRATLAGTDPASSLASALDGVRGLRTWVAGSSVDQPVRTDLDTRLAGVEASLVTAVTSAMGVTVTLPPVGAAALPGSTVTGTVEVTNAGTAPVTGLSGTLTVDGWTPASVAGADLPAGQSVQLPVSLTVPAQQAPGPQSAHLALTATVGGKAYDLVVTTPSWVTVTSGLDIGTPVATMAAGDPSQHAEVAVPVTNTGSAPVTTHAVLALPAGWRSVPSDDTVVPAGGAATLVVPVVVPLDVVGGATPVTVSLRRAATVLASKDATATFPLATPPTGTVTDHVDFGESTSETAHAVTGSPSSGTSTEAGVTRRYSNTTVPGSWFEATLAVPAGKPFVLRSIETYDRPNTKKYDVLVDGVRAKTQLVPRTAAGGGTEVYDALVDSPDALARTADGKAVVRFLYPTDASGFYDPSIADTWVLPVGDDTRAPDVSAVVTAGTPGDDGWFRSPTTLTVSAADDRDAAPAVETGTDAGWSAYTGPVPVTGEGRHEVSFRATDAAGNRSAARSVTVGIDTVAPTSEVAVTRGSGVEGADSATLVLTSTDATSGVARTLYRLDGGAWTVATGPVQVTGFGEHVLDLAATDRAGNAEVMQHATITLADVDAIGAVLAPQVSGTPAVGSTLTATAGSWNTKGLTFTYQWLRGGTPVAGATSASYAVGTADVSSALAVRVTASKAGRSGVATSVATAVVGRTASAVSVKVSKTKVRAGTKVRVTASVPGATGAVQVVVDGKVKTSAALVDGVATAKVKVRKGKHTLLVRFLGSPTQAASQSAPVTVKGTGPRSRKK